MSLTAIIVFCASLLGIAFLFTLKKIEVARNSRFAEVMRMRADNGALRIKTLLESLEGHLENIPFFLAAVLRYGIHIGALGFARLARTSEEYAHALAEMVSHKRTFERRETKSQFLKDVSEYPIRNSRDVNSNGAGKNGKSNDDGPVATL